MTGTDLARMTSNAVAVLDSTNEALARLDQWVTAAQQAHQLVAPLIGTAFVPDAYKPKIDPRATPEQKNEARQVAIANATAAVLQGITLGLDPMTALQQIYIIHGRPGMYSKLMVALVQSRGHEVWTEDLSDSRAVVCGRRKGTDYTERVVVTMEQARKAGWTSNAAYTKTPQDMLWSRAVGRVCDRIASDVLKGIASVEEIQDEIRAEAGEGTRVVARKRTQPTITATEEPPLDEPVRVEAEVKPAKRSRRAEPTTVDAEPELEPDQPMEERPITAAQQRKMHALLREHDREDRDVALVYISGVVGREITSTKELTVSEARSVIDDMEAPEAPPLDGDWPDVSTPGSAA